MEQILISIFSAVKYLFVSAIVYWIYSQTEESIDRYRDNKKLLFHSLLWCIAVSTFFTFTLGLSSCSEYDYGNISTCVEHNNDSWSPTNLQRLSEFVYYILLLYVPVLMAVLNTKHKHEN
jgi:hypothetical protein